MPRRTPTTELQAEEVAVSSPLRRSTRNVTSGTPSSISSRRGSETELLNSPAKVTRGRRGSQDEDRDAPEAKLTSRAKKGLKPVEEETVAVASPARPRRRTSTSSENNDTIQKTTEVPAKPRGRRTSTSTETILEENEDKPTAAKPKTRRLSVTESGEELEKPKTVPSKPKTRRSSVTSVEEVPEEKPAFMKKRRSSATELANIEPNPTVAKNSDDSENKKPVRSRSRRSAEPEEIPKVSKTRRKSTEIEDPNLDVAPRAKTTRSRRGSSEEPENTLSRSTRTRRQSFTDNVSMEPIKEAETDKDDTEEPKTAAIKRTPIKVKKPLVTENASHLEPIEEIEVKSKETPEAAVKRSRRRIISMKIEEPKTVKPDENLREKPDENLGEKKPDGNIQDDSEISDKQSNAIAVGHASEQLENTKSSENATPEKNNVRTPSKQNDDKPQTPQSNEIQATRRSPRINKGTDSQNVSPKDLKSVVFLSKVETPDHGNSNKVSAANKSPVVLMEKFEAAIPKEKEIVESSPLVPIVALKRFDCAPLESKVSSTTDGIDGSFEFHMNISIPNTTISSQEANEKDGNAEESLNLSTESCNSNKENVVTNSKLKASLENKNGSDVKQSSFVEEPMEVDECSYMQESISNTLFINTTVKVNNSCTEVEHITKADISGEVTILDEGVRSQDISEKKANSKEVIDDKTEELGNESLKLVLNEWNESDYSDEGNGVSRTDVEIEVAENNVPHAQSKNNPMSPTEPRRSLSKVALRRSSSPLVIKPIRKSESPVAKENYLLQNDAENTSNQYPTNSERSLSPILQSASSSSENLNVKPDSIKDSINLLDAKKYESISTHQAEEKESEESLKQNKSNDCETSNISEGQEVPKSDKTLADYDFNLPSDEEGDHGNANKSKRTSSRNSRNYKRLSDSSDEQTESSPPKISKLDKSPSPKISKIGKSLILQESNLDEFVPPNKSNSEPREEFDISDEQTGSSPPKISKLDKSPSPKISKIDKSLILQESDLDEFVPPNKSNSEPREEFDISETSDITPASSTNVSKLEFSITETDATQYVPTDQTMELDSHSVLSHSGDIASQTDHDEKSSDVKVSEENGADTESSKNMNVINVDLNSDENLKVASEGNPADGNEKSDSHKDQIIENEQHASVIIDEKESESIAQKNSTDQISESLEKTPHHFEGSHTVTVSQDSSNQPNNELKETFDETLKNTDREERAASLSPIKADEESKEVFDQTNESETEVQGMNEHGIKQGEHKSTEIQGAADGKEIKQIEKQPERKSTEIQVATDAEEIKQSEYYVEADRSLDVTESVPNSKQIGKSKKSTTSRASRMKHKGELSETESLIDEVFSRSSPDTSVKSDLEETKNTEDNLSTKSIPTEKTEAVRSGKKSRKQFVNEEESSTKADNSVTCTEETRPKSSEYKKSLEKFANSKMDKFLEKKLKELEEDDSSEDDSETKAYSEFIDGMAEEGEEDTPSEDSNEIVDEGESVGFSSDDSKHGDSDYENDSFICEDEEPELLSGNEDLALEEAEEKLKKKRSGRHKENIKTDSKTVKWSRIVAESDSSDNEVEIVEDNLQMNYADTDIVKKPVMESEIVEIEQISSSETCNRRSSLTIQENINVKEIKDTYLGQRINSLVESFCNTIKTKGEIQLNLSLDFEQAEPPKEVKKEGSKVIIINDITVSPKAVDSDDDLHENNYVEELDDSEEPEKVKRLSVTLDEEDIQRPVPEKHLKRRLSKSLENVNMEHKKESKKKRKRKHIGDQKKHIKKASKQDIKKHISSQTKDAVDNLRIQTFSLMDQLVTDVKNRKKRNIKPSTAADNSWLEVKEVLKPSKTNTETPKQAVDHTVKHHPKDFKNQMLNDKTRVKRIDSKILLKRKLGYF